MSGFDQSPWQRRLSPRNDIGGDPLFSLEGVNTIDLTDGCFCWVRSNRSDYVFLRQETAAPSPPSVVQPNTGPGRWVLVGSVGAGEDVFAELTQPPVTPSGATITVVGLPGLSPLDPPAATILNPASNDFAVAGPGRLEYTGARPRRLTVEAKATMQWVTSTSPPPPPPMPQDRTFFLGLIVNGSTSLLEGGWAQGLFLPPSATGSFHAQGLVLLAPGDIVEMGAGTTSAPGTKEGLAVFLYSLLVTS
jgi:hypothetical protein